MNPPSRTSAAVSCALVAGALSLALSVHARAEAKPQTMQQVLDASKPSDWRPLDPENTLYLDLAAGRVVIELAPDYAPLHAQNIRTMVRAHYFDGLAILRVQDGFVTQWGDPNAEDKDKVRALGTASRTLAPEFERAIAKDLPFTKLPDGDVYAPEVGFSNGLPVARDAKAGKTWLAHCYGMVGAGRDAGVDSGSGAELYVVIGHAPRQLDRPPAPGPLGFYEKPEQRTSITSVRLAADVPESERTPLQVLRTDTPTFTALVESRRNRRDDWYKVPAGKIDLCSVPIPVRKPPAN